MFRVSVSVPNQDFSSGLSSNFTILLPVYLPIQDFSSGLSSDSKFISITIFTFVCSQYLGVSGSDTFTELDDRMRHFGFTIEDLGCCKCLRHINWGTHVFVGSIFTTAPTNSQVIASLMNL